MYLYIYVKLFKRKTTRTAAQSETLNREKRRETRALQNLKNNTILYYYVRDGEQRIDAT